MKKLVLLFLLIIFPIGIFAEDIPYNEAVGVAQELMRDYYLRGTNLQYNSSKATFGFEAPEEATSQDNKYLVCSAYAKDIYAYGFGMTDFPTVTADIKTYGMANREDPNKIVLYYGKKSASDSTIVRYVNGVQTTDALSLDEIVKLVKPGDVLSISHAMPAYDIIDSNNDGVTDDVLILHATRKLSVIHTRITRDNNMLSFDTADTPATNSLFTSIEEGSIKNSYLKSNSFFTRTKENEPGIPRYYDDLVIIRPFYKNQSGNAVFNLENFSMDSYNNSKVRTQYPNMYIEKTVDIGDNNVVKLGSSLKYTIKITNKSNLLSSGGVTYSKFYVEEQLGDYVEYLSSNGASFSNNKLKWTINSIDAGSSITLTYTVTVKNNLSNVNKYINSTGKVYKTTSGGYIETGTVKNKIIGNFTTPTNYQTCYNQYSSTKQGLALVDEVFKCATGQDINLDTFSFSSLFEKNTNADAKNTENAISIKSTSSLKSLILNDYWGGLIYNPDPDINYVFPIWNKNSAVPDDNNRLEAQYRAKTIRPSDFKEGDILIYDIDGTDVTQTNEDGTYAFIYLGGQFVGVNYKNDATKKRNSFTFSYYSDIYSADEDIANHFYRKYTSIKNNSNMLEFINYQTLYGKDNFVIIRPEFILKELASISVKTMPTKTNYIQTYENLDLSGGKLLLGYNDGTTETIDMTESGVSVSGFSNSTVGTKTLTVTYKDKTTTFNVEIISKQVSSISVKTKPTKTTYIQNYETLDLTGGVIKVSYNDNSTNNVSMTNEGVSVTGFSNTTTGTKTLTVSYLDHTATFTVDIIPKQVSSISVKTNPTKTSYIQNYETLDLTGGVIKVSYTDNSTTNIPMTNEGVSVTGFSNTSVGTKTLTVSYLDHTATFTVNIVAKSVSSISVKTNPTKTTYIQNHETLDLTGGVIKVNYNDNSTNNVSMTNEGVTVSGFSNTSTGTRTITVKYQGKTATFDVEIVSKTVSSISVKTAPTKTTYIQNYEELDLTGGVININYSDGSVDEISMTNNAVTVSGFSNSEVGNKTVTLKYQGKSTTLTVSIISKQASSISVKTNPTKSTYIQNYEDLDLTGGVITVSYTDNSSDEIPMTNPDVTTSGFSNTTTGNKEVTVEYLNKTTTFTVEVVSKQISSISVKTAPMKTTYIHNYERLDLTGGIINVNYNDNSKDEVSMTNEEVSVSGFSNSELGNKTITLTYRNKTTTFTIEVISKQVVSIEVKTPPTGLDTIVDDKSVNLTGGVLLVKYTDNSTEEIPMTNESVSVARVEKVSSEKRTIVFDYFGHQITISYAIKSTLVNPETGEFNYSVIFFLLIFVSILSFVYVIKKQKML